MWYIYTHTHTCTHNVYTRTHTMKYYSAIKKNEILPFATMWMELECIMLRKIKSGREKQISYDSTHRWNIRNKTDEQKGSKNKIKTETETNPKRLLNTENRVAGGVLGGGMG